MATYSNISSGKSGSPSSSGAGDPQGEVPEHMTPVGAAGQVTESFSTIPGSQISQAGDPRKKGGLYSCEPAKTWRVRMDEELLKQKPRRIEAQHLYHGWY